MSYYVWPYLALLTICVAPASWRFARLKSGKLNCGGLRKSALVYLIVTRWLASSVFDFGCGIGHRKCGFADEPAVRELFLTYQERRRLAGLWGMQGLRGAILYLDVEGSFFEASRIWLCQRIPGNGFSHFPEPELISGQSFSATPAHFESLIYRRLQRPFCFSDARCGYAIAPIAGEIRFLNLIEDEHSNGVGPARSVAGSLREM